MQPMRGLRYQQELRPAWTARRKAPVHTVRAAQQQTAIQGTTVPDSTDTSAFQDALISERGTCFVTGKAFYRAESAQGRDLAMLAASLHRRRTGSLRVLDVMAGSGVRGARYLKQAGADEVWCNDYNPHTHEQLVFNLCGTAVDMYPQQAAQGSTSNPHQAVLQAMSTAGLVGVAKPSAAAGSEVAAESAVGAALPELVQQQLTSAVQQWEQAAVVGVPAGLHRQVWQWQVGPPKSAAHQPDSLVQHHQPDSLVQHHQADPVAPVPGADRQQQGPSAHASQHSQSCTPAEFAQQQHESPGGLLPCQQTARTQLTAPTRATQQNQDSPPHPATQAVPPMPLHNSHDSNTQQDCQYQSHVSDDQLGARREPSASETEQLPSITLKVSHMDAKRLLASLYLAEDFYDLIDIDSFGSDSSFLGAAIDAVQYGGLLYLTSTDGFSSSGRRPLRSLAAYGCYTRAVPFANEQGLRMLIGAAVKEAAARGVALTPVYSLFSYHGPVFRVMLRAKRTAVWPVQHYKFVTHCHVHGTAGVLDWPDLGAAVCSCVPCPPSHEPAPLTVAGPMWTGPLHDRQEVLDMTQEAQRLGWSGYSPGAGFDSFASSARTKKNGPRPLEEVMQVMLEEADERLPPGYICMDSLGRYVAAYPPRDKLLGELRSAGHAAARCHLDAKSFRTSASMEQIVAAATRLGVKRRLDCPWPADAAE